MIIYLHILLDGVALLLLLPVIVFFAEVLLAVTCRGKVLEEVGGRPRLVIMVPAYNEAMVIDGTIRSIIPQLATSDRLVVVADNCTDETAPIAAAAGAEVITRADSTHRGKGYALDFGIRYLERDSPEVVIVIDADCQVAAGSIDRLARDCVRTGRPAQALYLMYAPKDAGLTMRIAQFAWSVKNQVRPTGLRRLGMPCQLMGSGMAFPWACISMAQLASGHIVEDLKLGIDLARAGTPPLFCPGALVTSQFPVSNEGIRNQRARWEHGHLGVIFSDAPRLLWDCVCSWNVSLMALALDLVVPPVALLSLQVAAVWFLTACFCAFTRMQFPVDVMTVSAVLLILSVLLSWARYGRCVLSPGELASLALYPLWKIPLYLKFLVARQLEWVRSERDEGKR